MPHAHITGTGGHVPERVVHNDDLRTEYGIDTDDAWIASRTGVRARRYAAPGVSTSDLAAPAARRALEAAGLEPTDVDLVVFCTLSPDHHFPGSGVYLQALLGLPDHGAFPPCLDVRNQCSGFLYGLAAAVGMIRSGMTKRALVVGAEIHSAALDLSTRGRTVASLFGDGAGAVVVEGREEPGGVGALHLGADGRFADALSQRVWDIRRRPYIAVEPDGSGRVPVEDLWARMDGRLVFKHAVERMVASLQEVCAAEDISLEDVDVFALHQANARINQQVATLLDIPEHKLLFNIHKYGNTTAATIPLLLDEAVRTGKLLPGMTVALAAFGSGFTWGASILRWTAPTT